MTRVVLGRQETKKPRFPREKGAFRVSGETSFDALRLIFGGAGGIRTRGGDKPTHAFQACDLNHSSTAPRSLTL